MQLLKIAACFFMWLFEYDQTHNIWYGTNLSLQQSQKLIYEKNNRSIFYKQYYVVISL